MTDLVESVREIVLDELELEGEELTPDGEFVADYQADSLTLISMLTRIEKDLGISVPKDEVAHMATFDDTLTVVRRHA